MEWTPQAEETFEIHLSAHLLEIKDAGADPEEVRSDLRAHVEETIAECGRKVVTEDDVRRIFPATGRKSEKATSGSTDGCRNKETGRSEPAERKNSSGKILSDISNIFVVCCGIFLPVAALLLELSTGICGEMFFNPIPTFWHVIMVASVPILNSCILWRHFRGTTRSLLFDGIANGAVIGVSFFYSLIFIPLIPLGLIGLLIFGIGILPLCPLLSLLAAIKIRLMLRLKSVEKTLSLSGVLLPAVCAFLLFFIIDLPSSITYYSLGKMSSDDATARERERALRLLRNYGDDDIMLRLCYQRASSNLNIYSAIYNYSGKNLSSDQMRKVYYLVTGIPFNAVNPPRLKGLARRGDRDFDEWDPNVGGDSVEQRLSKLSLDSSRIDSSIDSDAGVSYTEWTMEFKNASKWQQHEARAQIVLPEGGIVSRLTLWIDGEEREAAFAGRNDVKAAYKKVVSRKRDPALITTSGKDKILFQCFPVPQNGMMKVRIGITSPVRISSGSRNKAIVQTPYFAERNFVVSKDFSSSLWAESKNPLEPPEGFEMKKEKMQDGTCALRGNVKIDMMENFTLAVSRNPEIAGGLVENSKAGTFVIQGIKDVEKVRRDKFVVVVDCSGVVAGKLPEIKAALEACPGLCSLVLAGDNVSVAENGKAVELANSLSKGDFNGGCDNVPALERAWEIAAEAGNCPIIWIHGPAPVEISSTAPLLQRWERRPNGPDLYDVQVQSGPNRIANQLGESVKYHHLRGQTDLKAVLENIIDGGHVLDWSWNEEASFPGSGKLKKSSDHILRLWAASRIDGLLKGNAAGAREKAIKIAGDYHIVTPVSGAVVLENAAQYRESNLEPASEDSIPTIPEPETWMLLAAAAIFLFIIYRMRKCGLVKKNIFG
ncbi:MAG TPA: hypothetical protein DET40_20880 [Lentisphaeria bacterium]|nr:MAG: hypothetical protein A2X45_15500 [Lentisphaerae bacterium GWF2_50_93]HCE46008.1 hypothetical protein [Lentisphaeria bacterium]